MEKEEDIKFLKLNERNDKWWYSFDSKTILNIREKKITEYSFNNLKEFYSKVKLLIKKDIKKSSELLQNRTELKSKAKILLNQFKELFNNQEKLQKQEDIIKEIENEINKLPEDPTLKEINKLITNINNVNTRVKTSRKRQIRDNNEHVTCQFVKIIAIALAIVFLEVSQDVTFTHSMVDYVRYVGIQRKTILEIIDIILKN